MDALASYRYQEPGTKWRLYMTDRFRIAAAQLNPTVGALDTNVAKAVEAWEQAKLEKADLLVLPEMFVGGYQLYDLVQKPAFHRACVAAVEDLAAQTVGDGPHILIGAPLFEDGALFNAVFLLENGGIKTVFRKHELPNYGVFDEKRLFTSAAPGGPISINGVRIGVPICEDAWFPDVSETFEESGAEILIVPNGSPYARDKYERRMQSMVARVVETGLPLLYVNMVGGQDDQVFDGGSFALNPGAKLAMQAPFFDEAMIFIDYERGEEGWAVVDGAMGDVPDEYENDYRAMVESLRDYVLKNGFERVVLGLSGGVDSGLVATIAADALGPENVWCVMLPSRYTSEHSLEDAAELAAKLGAPYVILPIDTGVGAIEDSLGDFFAGTVPGVAEENIQSRLRGLYLMALSNKFGHMLLTTGNKSEVAVGYATLYGDMSGGYNPLKDLYKMRVFETCRWRNKNHREWMLAPEGVVIPPRVIDKPPSAELREDQKDEDSLPPYEVLDAILEMLIEGDAAIADVVAAGYERETVERVEHLLSISEYKRFQSAPGTKLSRRAFWLERRYPMTNRYRDRA
jgi:NAD+ synthase